MLLVVAKASVTTTATVDNKLHVFCSSAEPPLMSAAAGPNVEVADPLKLPFLDDKLPNCKYMD